MANHVTKFSRIMSQSRWKCLRLNDKGRDEDELRVALALVLLLC